MPLLTQAELERAMRIWFHRLANAVPESRPTDRTILSLFVATIDRVIRLDRGMLQVAVELAARYDSCGQADVIAAIERAALYGVDRGHQAIKATHVLEALIARIAHPSRSDDRVRIEPDATHVLDFLDEWFTCQPPERRQEQPGGAPAVIAQVFAQLGTLNVTLWTAYLSQKQALVFDERVMFLDIDDHDTPSVRAIRDAGRAGDPEVHNYSLEFAKDTQLSLEQPDVTTMRALSPSVSDRVIAVSPGYHLFDQDGRVALELSRAIPPSIPHILAADPQRGPSCAAQVAQDHKTWIIGGLHHIKLPADQLALESDLRQVPADVTMHVEIPGSDILPWFQGVLQRYIDSIGVNIDDIERLAQTMACNRLVRTDPPGMPSELERPHIYPLLLAFWLACELELERVYIHGLKLDYIVRRRPPADALDPEARANLLARLMEPEVRADLLAKTVVANRARAAGVVERPSRQFGLSASNLEAFIEVCSLRAFPIEPDWATLEQLGAFQRILHRGWFEDTFEHQGHEIGFMVAIIPVALFRLDPGGLKFVGAGDTTSAVSFVFGQFSRQGLKHRL